ncbi:MAG: hypothetical protein V3S11_01565 [Elusimicrobiota bacterium]
MGPQRKRRAKWNARQTWVVLGLLVFCLALALPLYADAPIGEVEALRPAAGGAAEGRSSDVDVLAALEFEGLEIRDSRNQVVSRSAIEKGLRKGSQQSAKHAADLSKLSGLRALLAFMERPDLLASALRTEKPIFERGEGAFVASPRKNPKVRPPAQKVLPAPEVRADFVSSPLLFCTTPGLVRVLNLRE